MLVKNRSGWTLLEYIDVEEKDIDKFPDVTGAYAILRIGSKYVVGYNSWRKQWEFKGLFKVEDAKGKIKHQAVFVCKQDELLPFTHEKNDEMDEIKLWDMNEDIGYVDECDVKIVQMVCE